MKKIALIILLCFISCGAFASMTNNTKTNDSIPKKEFKRYKNYVGLDVLGTIGKISYNRYFVAKEKVQVGFSVGLNALMTFKWRIPSPYIGFNVQTPISNKFFVFSQIGVETFGFVFPVLRNNLLEFYNVAPTFDLGISYEYKHFKINPIVFGISRDYPSFTSEESENPYNFFHMRMTIMYQF